MTYPMSSVVTAGMATAAAQYNNLRLDALTLGQAETEAVKLSQFLQRGEWGLKLQALGTNRLRVPATASDPAFVMIGGWMCAAFENVDLPTMGAPSGAAGTWYVLAAHAAGTSTFTLSVNTSAVPPADSRLIGTFYWNGSKIVPESVRTMLGLYHDAVGLAEELHKTPLTCQGRLTLVSGTPVPTDDVSSGVLYFTPCGGNRVHLYNPSIGRWVLYTFSELNLSLSGQGTGYLSDVFLYDNNGVLTLELANWSSYSARAAALTQQDGVYVRSGALHKRYLGTIAMSATAGVSLDARQNRLLWNYYNRFPREIKITESAASWTLAGGSGWRPWNNNTANRVNVVVGMEEAPITLDFYANAKSSVPTPVGVGIALDNTNINNADITTLVNDVNQNTCMAKFQVNNIMGYHLLQLTEWPGASGTATFYGASTAGACGALGWVWG